MKLLFSIAFISMITVGASGQLQLGVRGGLNLANRTVESSDQDMMFLGGPYLGIAASYGLNEKMSLTADLNYSAKGGRREYKSEGVRDGRSFITSGEFTDALNYIELPVMFNYHVKKWRIGAGAYFGYMLNGTAKGEVYTLYNDFDADLEEFDINYIDPEFEIMSRIDFGISAGVSYVGESGLGLQLRYAHGLANMFNTELTTTTATNYCISVGVLAYLWNPKPKSPVAPETIPVPAN